MQALSKLLGDEIHILVISVQALVSPCPDKAHLLPFDLLKTKAHIDRKNLISGKRCSGPCKSCNADGTLLGKNHAKEWKKIYNIVD